MRTLTIAAIACLLLAGSARAALIDYTGDAYEWVAYNSGTSTVNGTLPANTTEFTIDTDYGLPPQPEYVDSGELLKFSGGGTGVNLQLIYAEPNGGQHFASSRDHNPNLIFDDTLVDAYNGRQILHFNGADGGDGPRMEMVFTGLDPSKTYTFAGVAEYGSKFDCLSVASIVGADASINESVLTSNATTMGLPYFGMSPTTVSISYNEDDLAMWSGIDPGSDGSFTIIVQAMVREDSQGHNPAFNAFALAEEVIPEPATAVMLMVGAAAVLTRRSSRRACSIAA